jgi:Ricin-type beta-trefoil lectin domain
VTSSPDQSITVYYDESCSEDNGSYTSSSSGHFTGTTPVSHTLPSLMNQPTSCILAAAGGLTYGSGTIHVSVTSSSTAPAPEIKGYSSLCVDDTGNSTARGTKIETWGCYGGAPEQWSFSHGELIHRGQCINDKASGGSGTRVILYTCQGGSNELWTHNSHGEYVLKAHNGTLCLDDPAYSKHNGTQLEVYTCHNTANQHWSLP